MKYYIAVGLIFIVMLCLGCSPPPDWVPHHVEGNVNRVQAIFGFHTAGIQIEWADGSSTILMQPAARHTSRLEVVKGWLSQIKIGHYYQISWEYDKNPQSSHEIWRVTIQEIETVK